MEKEIYSVEYFFRLPLYKKIRMSFEDLQKQARDIQEFSGSFDQYCVECDKNATFVFRNELRFSSRRLGNDNDNDNFSGFSKPAFCARNEEHKAIFHFQVSSDGLQKTGQYPSIADVVFGDIKKYKKIFDKNEMNGLMKAIGLFAHGVGAGAFIYLRKIFEAQVEKAHILAEKNEDWDENAYKTMRMDDRIQALKNHLPELLVINRKLYSILSMHLHDGPSEEQCLKNFNVVLQGIFVIADDELNKLEKADRLASFEKSKQEFLNSTGAKL